MGTKRCAGGLSDPIFLIDPIVVYKAYLYNEDPMGLRRLCFFSLLLLEQTFASASSNNETLPTNSTILSCDQSYAITWSVVVSVMACVFAGLFCFEISSDRL